MQGTISIIEYKMQTHFENILHHHKGPFTQDTLVKARRNLGDRFSEDPGYGKKLFSIYVELAQNIANYSLETNFFSGERKVGVGTMIIGEDNEYFTILAANLVEPSKVMILEKRCQHINSLSHDKLRRLKGQRIATPRRQGQTGGDIGLIEIALKSDSPLEIAHHHINDNQSFVAVTVRSLKANNQD